VQPWRGFAYLVWKRIHRICAMLTINALKQHNNSHHHVQFTSKSIYIKITLIVLCLTCWISSLHCDSWLSASSSFLLLSAWAVSSCEQWVIRLFASDFILLMYSRASVKSSSTFSAPTWILPGCCSFGKSNCKYTNFSSQICPNWTGTILIKG